MRIKKNKKQLIINGSYNWKLAEWNKHVAYNLFSTWGPYYFCTRSFALFSSSPSFFWWRLLQRLQPESVLPAAASLRLKAFEQRHGCGEPHHLPGCELSEMITVGGSLSQTLIDSLDDILGVKSILFSHLSYFASGLEEQTETAGLATFCACFKIAGVVQAWLDRLLHSTTPETCKACVSRASVSL